MAGVIAPAKRTFFGAIYTCVTIGKPTQWILTTRHQSAHGASPSRQPTPPVKARWSGTKNFGGVLPPRSPTMKTAGSMYILRAFISPILGSVLTYREVVRARP